MTQTTGSGTTLEKEVVTTDAGDHDRFAHYFRKSDLESAFFDGVEITALCGKKDVPTRDFTKYPVCDSCKEVIEGLPAGPAE
jgi:hypothetical protein